MDSVDLSSNGNPRMACGVSAFAVAAGRFTWFDSDSMSVVFGSNDSNAIDAKNRHCQIFMNKESPFAPQHPETAGLIHSQRLNPSELGPRDLKSHVLRH